MLSRPQIEKLAKRRNCPRCSMEKTEGTALCRRCRFKLPTHMRLPLEGIAERDTSVVANALRAAANYFEVHFRSVRAFGGGRMR
jgi:predicted amidophosphoribosyltransferase